MDLSHVTIQEHKSSSYAPRTYQNAAADVTVAFAVDFTTAGERLTKKAAGEKLVDVLMWSTKPIDAARKLWRKVDDVDAQSLNVAGNGIYTMSMHGWDQECINQYVWDVLSLVCGHSGIDKIVTGGQTGADLAGAVFGAVIGLETVVTLPKGYRQRFEDGIDITQTQEDIYKQIRHWAERIKR